MFGNLKDRFYGVQHDLTQGLRSISSKAKSANQRLVRKAAFTIAEDVKVNSNDQCFDCNLEAGSEIIVKFYKNWSEMHWKGRDIAQEAEEVDKVILDILKKCTSLDCAITSFHQELSFLPDVIQNIDIATESIENIHSQIDVFEQLIDEYEDVAVENILERRKAKETRILDRYVEHLEVEYNKLAGEFHAKKSIEEEETQKLERQASIERQKVYEDVFLEEMQHYIIHGSTEKPIVGSRSSQSLDDITLDEDTDSEKQLQDFLEAEETVTTDGSLENQSKDVHEDKQDENPVNTTETSSNNGQGSQNADESIEELEKT